MVVGLSVAGAFRSNDDGASWTPPNGGVLADFHPGKFPEVGQCLCITCWPIRGIQRGLYQQNHCGTCIAPIRRRAWTDLSPASALALDLAWADSGR